MALLWQQSDHKQWFWEKISGLIFSLISNVSFAFKLAPARVVRVWTYNRGLWVLENKISEFGISECSEDSNNGFWFVGGVLFSTQQTNKQYHTILSHTVIYSNLHKSTLGLTFISSSWPSREGIKPDQALIPKQILEKTLSHTNS